MRILMKGEGIKRIAHRLVRAVPDVRAPEQVAHLRRRSPEARAAAAKGRHL